MSPNLDTIDEHFAVRQANHSRFSAEVRGKWYAVDRAEWKGYLRADGVVRCETGFRDPPETTGWFDTYADIEAAYAKWLARRDAL